MAEISAADSFVVRIYRYDTEDLHKFTGQVEKLDGNDEPHPFTTMDELARAFKLGVEKRRRKQNGIKESAALFEPRTNQRRTSP